MNIYIDILEMRDVRGTVVSVGAKARIDSSPSDGYDPSAVEKLERELGPLVEARLLDALKTKRRPSPARWAGVEYHYAVCSKCGGQVSTGFETTADAVALWPRLYPFCPHCGTPMRSSEYDGPGASQYRPQKKGGAK